MTDPLTLLRQYIINEREIIEGDNQVTLGEISWPKNVKTNYLVHGSGRNGKPKNYYTLESVLYFLKNANLFHPEYVRQAAMNNIDPVHRPDRGDLLKYLKGQTSTSLKIDKSAPLEKPTQIKRTAEDTLELFPKKPHSEDSEVESVTESSVTVSNVKSLPKVMPVEKIIAIKEKHMEKKTEDAWTGVTFA